MTLTSAETTPPRSSSNSSPSPPSSSPAWPELPSRSSDAGVSLATGFVHMLSEASEALQVQVPAKAFPWSKFPFTGFFTMVAALLTFLLDFLGTQYYERKQGLNCSSDEQPRVGSSDSIKVFGEEESGGMHAHAAHHRHNHTLRNCKGKRREDIEKFINEGVYQVDKLKEEGLISNIIYDDEDVNMKQRVKRIRNLKCFVDYCHVEGVKSDKDLPMVDYRKYSRVRKWTVGIPGGKELIAIIRASGSISRVESQLSVSSSGIIAKKFIEKIRTVRGKLDLTNFPLKFQCKRLIKNDTYLIEYDFFHLIVSLFV